MDNKHAPYVAGSLKQVP